MPNDTILAAIKILDDYIENPEPPGDGDRETARTALDTVREGLQASLSAHYVARAVQDAGADAALVEICCPSDDPGEALRIVAFGEHAAHQWLKHHGLIYQTSQGWCVPNDLGRRVASAIVLKSE